MIDLGVILPNQQKSFKMWQLSEQNLIDAKEGKHSLSFGILLRYDYPNGQNKEYGTIVEYSTHTKSFVILESWTEVT